MNEGRAEDLYRQLPSVDEFLRRPRVRAWEGKHPRRLLVDEARAAIGRLRAEIAAGRWNGGERLPEAAEQYLEASLERLSAPSLRRVLNATGVILHTNLGRAPLPAGAIAAISEAARGYSNLEYDLAAGVRGKRDVHAGVLERLLGRPAVVVNNNAAAVFLALNEIAAGGEVVVSRGELIEIGDGFRIPEIMARSGARLREVGTTNRTRIRDYRAAVGPETRLLLRVHPSNFRIVGFTERPALDELAALGKETGLPVMEDLGSGCLFDVAEAGLEGEPPVARSLAAGAGLVTFSGDKLLGGPQAGVIAGAPEWVRRVRRNPLFRALRVDKLTYAALEATLRCYLREEFDAVPVLRMIRQSPETVRRRAEDFVARAGLGEFCRFELKPGESVLGGGSTPGQSLPSTVIAITPPAGMTAARVERRLRLGRPPVIARCEKQRVELDLRTVFPEEEDDLAAALREALRPEPEDEPGESAAAPA